MLYEFLFSPIRATCPAHLISRHFISNRTKWLTDSLGAWTEVLVVKLKVAHLTKRFPAFRGEPEVSSSEGPLGGQTT
jgi:hypothetical protein